MALTYERLSRFVNRRGNVSITFAKGTVTMRAGGTPDMFEAIEKAAAYQFEQKVTVRPNLKW